MTFQRKGSQLLSNRS